MARFPPDFAMLHAASASCGGAPIVPVPARFGGRALEALRRAACREPCDVAMGGAMGGAKQWVDLADFHQVPRSALFAMCMEDRMPVPDDVRRDVMALCVADDEEPFDRVPRPFLFHILLEKGRLSARQWDDVAMVACARVASSALVDLEARWATGALRFVARDLGPDEMRFRGFDAVDTSVDTEPLRARRHPYFFHDMNRGSLATREGILHDRAPEDWAAAAQAWNDEVWAALTALLRAFPDELVVAGGFVTSLLCPGTRFAKTMDVDLFVHNASAERATQIVREIVRLLAPDVCRKSVNAFTMVSATQTLAFQVVTWLHASRADVLHGFDLAPSQALLALDPATGALRAWGTEAFCASVREGAVRPSFAVPGTAQRLWKYAVIKGFRLVVPNVSRVPALADVPRPPPRDMGGAEALRMVERMLDAGHGRHLLYMGTMSDVDAPAVVSLRIHAFTSCEGEYTHPNVMMMLYNLGERRIRGASLHDDLLVSDWVVAPRTSAEQAREAMRRFYANSM